MKQWPERSQWLLEIKRRKCRAPYPVSCRYKDFSGFCILNAQIHCQFAEETRGL